MLFNYYCCYGCRSFPVAGARIWKTLPLHVTSSSSSTVFKQRLKLHLFCFLFPGLSPVWLLSCPCSVCGHIGHYKKLIDWLIDCIGGDLGGKGGDGHPKPKVEGRSCFYLPIMLNVAATIGPYVVHPLYALAFVFWSKHFYILDV